MKILAFGASSSKNSINKKLATHAANVLATMCEEAQVEVLDLNDYEMPLFSEDIEKEIGQPEQAHQFLKKIEETDVLIISFAEHNGSYSAAYKNVFDWATRILPKVYQEKPAVILATSPGARGGGNVLEMALNGLPRFKADIKGSLSVPSFEENFDSEKMELSNVELRDALIKVVSSLV